MQIKEQTRSYRKLKNPENEPISVDVNKINNILKDMCVDCGEKLCLVLDNTPASPFTESTCFPRIEDISDTILNSSAVRITHMNKCNSPSSTYSRVDSITDSIIKAPSDFESEAEESPKKNITYTVDEGDGSLIDTTSITMHMEKRFGYAKIEPPLMDLTIKNRVNKIREPEIFEAVLIDVSSDSVTDVQGAIAKTDLLGPQMVKDQDHCMEIEIDLEAVAESTDSEPLEIIMSQQLEKFNKKPFVE